jgi:hypothetical protein
MLSSVCRMPSCRSREMRDRSASMARALRCRSKNTFSSDGTTCFATRSSQSRSALPNGPLLLRPLTTNKRPAGFSFWSKVTVINDLMPNSICVGPGSRGRLLIASWFRRSHPNPEPAPCNEFQQIVASRSSSKNPSARASAKLSGVSRSLSPAVSRHKKIRSRSISRKTRNACSARNQVASSSRKSRSDSANPCSTCMVAVIEERK